MRNRLTDFHHDEQGIAMVFAIMVAFVVLMLMVFTINEATHNQQQAAFDRERLTALNGAEAGLDWFYNNVQNSPASSTSTLQTAAYTGSVISGPNSVSFTATPTYFSDAAGTTVFSGALSANNYPKSVKVVSVGTASDGSKRQMETFMVLHPVFGGFDGALITNSNTNFTNNFTVNGNNGNDGDIVVLNGNFSAPSGLETVKGSIYVATPGYTMNIGTQLHVYGSVWATGSVTINHPQALVDLDAKSTSAGITVSSGAVSGKAYYCTGSAPSNVAGAKIQTCSLGNPPTTTFPQIQYDASAWTDQGYYIQTFTGATACTDAQNWVEGNSTGTYKSGAGVPSGYTGVVVRITQNCTYSNSNNAMITLGSNLAIVTDGGINLSQQSTWNGSGSQRNLFFEHVYPSSGTYACGPTNGTYDLGDVALGNQTSFNSLVQTSVYTPCEAVMNNNNSSFQGQVIGGSMTIGNLFNMSYRPVLIPGSKVTGFKEDIAYIREVRAS